MSAQTELIAKLGEIFQTDRADLDFGIYKILGSRAKEINGYLSQTLPAQIKSALQNNEEHENRVYNHLLAFFSRYYDAGDFISQRRYGGKDRYAIPYNGEEVMLHWANKDQYYTKSGENFADYRFTLPSGKSVLFKLIAADTAKDNQKDNDQARLFVLAQAREAEFDDDGETIRQAVSPITVSDDLLTLSFEYKPHPKEGKKTVAKQQEERNEETQSAIKTHPAVQQSWAELFEHAPTDKQPERTLLEKHLARYTAKNSADYFIHKDLGGFLRRELDFYIKNEMLNLDDAEQSETALSGSLKLIRIFRAVAHDITAFLAQLENFQKKLWLKKKFVVGCHWLITLGQIPQNFHAEILANPRQVEAWKNLFVFKELPPRNLISFAESNPYLVVDTSLFAPEFQTRLVSALSDDHPLDDFTDGTIIHADNFQALNLLQARYREQVKCIYIDPPYNTGGDGFIYKDNYQHSSWASLINQTIPLAYSLQPKDGSIFASIDDDEQTILRDVMAITYGKANFINNIIWQKKFSPSNDTKWLSDNHDFIINFAKHKDTWRPNLLPRSKKAESSYKNPDNDFRGAWTSGDMSVKTYSAANDYPITTPTGNIIYPPKGACWRVSKEKFAEMLADNRIYFSKNGDGVPRIKRFLSEVKDGITPLTLWTYEEVGHNQEAKKELVGFFNVGVEISAEELSKATPKPVRLLNRVLTVGSDDHSLILDFFAGSGSTAHAVIEANRNSGKRKYILVEQGEYFNTVLKPRIQKAVYAAEWKDGKPVPDKDTGSLKGIAHAVKVLKLESYEDTLNNLVLRRPADLFAPRQPENMARDYLLHYMLDVESRGSLLNTDAFRRPFSYQMDIAADSAGASVRTPVDLVETFNYLLGLTVDAVDDKRFSEGYVMIEGSLKNERVLLVWRDCEKWDYDTLPKLLAKKQIAAGDSEYAEIYINGDHTLPTVFQDNDADGGAIRSLKIRSIEEAFLRLMFEEA